jgi:DNA-directed RNA polymerase subunit M/transcription elongation factor TFIIS
MRIEKQTRPNEWLLGSTMLCQTCGCLWLVPADETEARYKCRQCGSDVTAERPKTNKSANPGKSLKDNFG